MPPEIIIVTYSEQLALHTAYLLRRVLQSPWYQRYFSPRLAHDRTRVSDFATTAGGGVYAVSAEGSITGRGATIIVFDDPLNIDEAGNLDQIEKVNERFNTVIMSRLDNPKTGRVVISAHRLHQNDLAGHVLESGEWDSIALPFIAPKDQDYDLGGRCGIEKRAICCDPMRLRRPRLIGSRPSSTLISRRFISNTLEKPVRFGSAKAILAIHGRATRCRCHNQRRPRPSFRAGKLHRHAALSRL